MITERDIVRLIKGRRRSLGLTQSDVVTQLQLAGFDISLAVYKNVENNRRLLKVPEFLFLVDLLKINIDAILAELTGAMPGEPYKQLGRR